MILALMPEGPIAFDGKNYRYSKGERLYIDNLAKSFSKVIIISYVYRENDEMYEACSHSCFESDNIHVVELLRCEVNKVTLLAKIKQFLNVAKILNQTIKKSEIDIMYLFFPSYASAIGGFLARFKRIRHIIYAADDWEQASPCMFKWDINKRKLLYKVFLFFNKKMESYLGRRALFSVVAGNALLEKYEKFQNR